MGLRPSFVDARRIRLTDARQARQARHRAETTLDGVLSCAAACRIARAR
jgi:tRNA1(Val) A37 N6-methylase TrmN6